MPAEPVTLTELFAAIVAAIGGKEGIAYLINRRNNKNGTGYVTKEFCGERHSNVEKLLDEVRIDVKTLLTHTESKT